jgi:hypothetical protein
MANANPTTNAQASGRSGPFAGLAPDARLASDGWSSFRSALSAWLEGRGKAAEHVAEHMPTDQPGQGLEQQSERGTPPVAGESEPSEPVDEARPTVGTKGRVAGLQLGESLGASGAEALMAYLDTWLIGKGQAAEHLPELLEQESTGRGQADTSPLSVAASGSGPSVSTNKADYAPGETALITGSGFEPLSTVQITIVETADKDLDGAGPDNAELDDYGSVATVQVAADGTFEATWLVPPRPDASALGATLELTASSSSGETAVTTFTDADPAVTLTGNLTTVTLDEDEGLQNATDTPAPPNPAGDANDNDILFTATPSPFQTRLNDLTKVNGVSAIPINAALSGYTGAPGNTGLPMLTISGSYTNLAFTDGNKALFNGTNSNLTTSIGGNSIFLYTDSTNDNIVLGREGNGTTANPNGAIVFAVYLDEAADKLSARIWTVQYQAIVHPNPALSDEPVNLNDLLYVTAVSTQSFDLDKAPSGQQLFIMFGDGSITGGVSEVGIVATGKDPADQSAGFAVNTGDTVNTSQASKFGDATFGTNNQMITPNEGIWFTFVTNPNPEYTVPKLSPGEAGTEAFIDFGGWENATGAEFTVVQLQSGKSAKLTLSAYLEDDAASVSDGVNFVDKLLENQLTERVEILDVQVIENPSGTLQASAVKNGDIWTISNLEAGDKIVYVTDGDHNRVLIENAGSASGQGNASFDIGGFTLNSAETTALEVGDKVFFEDSGPSGTAGLYTNPATVYLFDGNARWNALNPDGNYEGNNDFGLPTGDRTANGPNTVQVNFADAFTPSAYDAQDGVQVSYAFSLVFGTGASNGAAVTFDPSRDTTNQTAGTAVTSDGLAVVWKQVTPGVLYQGVVNYNTPQEAVVFSLGITSAGLVTFTQLRELDHTRADTTNPFTTDIWYLNGQQISVKRIDTIDEGDDNPFTEEELGDLAGVFAIGDDGPKTTAGAVGDTVQLITSDGAAVGVPPGNYTGGLDNYAEGTYDAAFLAAVTALYGADGAGTKVAGSFELDLGVDSGTSSGLTSNGATVYLYKVGSGSTAVIYGSTTASGSWNPNSPSGVVFKVEVTNATTGTVKLTQLAQVDHSNDITDPASPNSATTGFPADSITLADDKIVLKGTVTTTDGEGATKADSVVNNLSLNIGSDLEFRDDGPTLAFGDLKGTVTPDPPDLQTGLWSGRPGADLTGTLSIAAVDTDPVANGIQFDMVTAAGVTSKGTMVFTPDATGGYGTLTANFDNNSTNGNETINFTLVVNQDGTYDFAIDQVIRPVVVLSTANGQLAAGGPDPVQTLLIPNTGLKNPPIPSPSEELVFFAVDANTASNPQLIAGTPDYMSGVSPALNPYGNSAIGLGLADLTETQLQNLSAMTNINGSGINGTGFFPFIRDQLQMNVSTSGIGVNNNVLQGADLPGQQAGTINPYGSGVVDESFVVNPESLASQIKVYVSKTAGGFQPPDYPGGTADKRDYLYWNVYDELGNNSGPTLVHYSDVFNEAGPGGTGENLWSFTIDIDDVNTAGNYIDALQLTMGYGDIKIVKIEVVVEGNTPPNDILLDFQASLTDTEGDKSTSNFEVNLYGNETTATATEFDYILQGGTLGASPEAFNALDQAGPLNRYLIQGFDVTEDSLVLNNLAGLYTTTLGNYYGNDGNNDTLVQSSSGDLYVVIADATLQASNILG